MVKIQRYKFLANSKYVNENFMVSFAYEILKRYEKYFIPLQ